MTLAIVTPLARLAQDQLGVREVLLQEVGVDGGNDDVVVTVDHKHGLFQPTGSNSSWNGCNDCRRTSAGIFIGQTLWNAGRWSIFGAANRLRSAKKSNQNEFSSRLKQMRQQAMARKASWISARRS
jgi:hypothetical protein